LKGHTGRIRTTTTIAKAGNGMKGIGADGDVPSTAASLAGSNRHKIVQLRRCDALIDKTELA